MSTLFQEHTPFDILYRNLFKADEAYAPALNSKQPHPLDIYYDQEGLYFEIACTGLIKEDISIEIESDVLRISYTKPKEEEQKDKMFGKFKKGLHLLFKSVEPRIEY